VYTLYIRIEYPLFMLITLTPYPLPGILTAILNTHTVSPVQYITHKPFQLSFESCQKITTVWSKQLTPLKDHLHKVWLV